MLVALLLSRFHCLASTISFFPPCIPLCKPMPLTRLSLRPLLSALSVCIAGSTSSRPSVRHKALPQCEGKDAARLRHCQVSTHGNRGEGREERRSAVRGRHLLALKRGERGGSAWMRAQACLHLIGGTLVFWFVPVRLCLCTNGSQSIAGARAVCTLRKGRWSSVARACSGSTRTAWAWMQTTSRRTTHVPSMSCTSCVCCDCCVL